MTFEELYALYVEFIEGSCEDADGITKQITAFTADQKQSFVDTLNALHTKYVASV